MKIAIIGAGISGLAAGTELQNKGHEVSIFEKARGVGGRMSTRRTDDFTFDHGTQYFTARTKPFQNFVKEFEKLGILKEWKGKVVSLEKGKKPEKRLWFEAHFIASPSMNSLCKKLAENLSVRVGVEISKINSCDGSWNLTSKEGEDLGTYDWVISSAPPAQTYNLMPNGFLFKDKIKDVEMHACFALMLGFKEKLKINWMAAKLINSKLKWVTVNSERPDRDNNVTTIQIHSKDKWADKNKDLNIDEVQKQMIEEFKLLTGIDGNLADYKSTHRWLYSSVKVTSKDMCYVDFDNNLAACGDWCISSRIEDAWISATTMVNEICEKNL